MVRGSADQNVIYAGPLFRHQCYLCWATFHDMRRVPGKGPIKLVSGPGIKCLAIKNAPLTPPTRTINQHRLFFTPAAPAAEHLLYTTPEHLLPSHPMNTSSPRTPLVCESTSLGPPSIGPNSSNYFHTKMTETRRGSPLRVGYFHTPPRPTHKQLDPNLRDSEKLGRVG